MILWTKIRGNKVELVDGRRGAHHLAMFGLTGLLCWALLIGCGAQNTPEPDAPVAVGETADVGAALESDQWTVKLIDAAYSVQQVGSGAFQDYNEFDTGAVQAEGIFVVLPVELTNRAGEIRMFGKASGLVVMDEQGRETELASGRPHQAVAYTAERWGEFENRLYQNPMEAGVTWEGPLVFDVPKDASGLVLHFRGSGELIDLGL